MNITPQTIRPNIILILADDMGFSDIGCFGAEIATPHLDALAQNGVRASQMYNSARCCPTRACILTGVYPQQAGVGLMVGDAGVGPAYQGFLRDDCVTIAEALQSSGYRTFMSGKWHVGGEYNLRRPDTWRPGDARHPLPRQRGFDEFYGTLSGAGSYFNPPTLFRNETPEVPSPGYYLTDAISDEAVRMIDSTADSEAPFFLYTAYTAPHWPLHACEEDIARYRGQYLRGGWDAVRTSRHEMLKGMGLLNPTWPISPRDPQAPAWTDAEHREWEDMRMAVYAAQIDRMDQGIGRILAALRRAGKLENTLIVFLSDNGGCAEFLCEDTSQPWPGCYAVPTLDGRMVHVGNTPSLLPGPADTFMSYDLPWANASNAPFRYYKHWVHEGGISTPFIAWWPAGLGAARIVHQPCHIVDLMATFLDAAGVPHPAEYQDRPMTAPEGESLLPLLQGRPWARTRPLYWEHHGNCAVRDGEWKLVRQHPDAWELYHIAEDRTELHDRASGEPSRVAAMTRRYDAWAARVGVLPWPLRP